MKIRKGQLWKDRKNGNILLVHKKHHDMLWDCVLVESKINHKMPEFTINKYYQLVEVKAQ